MAAVTIFGLALLAGSASAAWLIRTGVQPAIAQSGAQVAATTPDPIQTGSLASASRQPQWSLVDRPTIDRMRFETGAATVVEGRAPVFSTVTLLVAGEAIATTRANGDGAWSMIIERGFGVGDHRIHVRSMQLGQHQTMTGDAIRLSVPRGHSSPLEILLAARDTAEQPLQPSIVRVAQAQPEPVKGGKANDGPVEVIREWMRESEKSFQDVGVKGVSAPRATSAAVPAPAAQASKTVSPAAAPGFVDSIYDWFKQASDSYQATISKGLMEPVKKPPSAVAKREPQPASPPPPAVKAQQGEATKTAAEDARLQAEAKTTAQEKLKAAQAEREAELKAAEARRKSGDEAAAKAAEQKAADDARQAEAAQANAQSEASKRLAQEAEARQSADMQAKAAAAAKAAEEAKLAEAAKRLAQEADAKRVLEAEAKRLADAKAAEEARQAASARAAAQEAEAARKLAQEREAKRIAAAKAAEDAQRLTAAKVAQEAKAAQQTRLQAQAVKNAEAKRSADERAAADVKRRAIDLAEAASRMVIAVPSGSGGNAPLPPLPSVSTRPGPPPAAATPRFGEASPPPPPRARIAKATEKPGSALEPSSRSALGLPQPVKTPLSRKGSLAPQHANNKAGQCRLAGRKVIPPAYYIVETGDSLWDIAEKHYKDASKVRVLERANNLGDEDLIQPCQRVYVPALKNG